MELKFARTGLAPVKSVGESAGNVAYATVNLASNGKSATLKFYQKASLGLGLRVKPVKGEPKKSLGTQSVSIDFIEGQPLAVVYNSTETDYNVQRKVVSKSYSIRLLKKECEKLFSTLELPIANTQFNLKEVEVEGVKVFLLEKGEPIVKTRTETQIAADAKLKALTEEFKAELKAKGSKPLHFMKDFQQWKTDRNK